MISEVFRKLYLESILQHPHELWLTMDVVLFVVTLGFENILALAVNLVTYFSGVMHLELADAANQLTNFLGAMHILTILAALLVDAYTGRFRAVLTAGFLEFAVCFKSSIHAPSSSPSIKITIMAE